MIRRTAWFPDRLRARGATDLEKQLLNAAAKEEPSPELRERMAQAIGLSAAAIGVAAGAKLGAGAGTSKAALDAAAIAKLGTGTLGAKAAAWGIALLPWVSGGVVVVALAAAVAGALRGGSSPERQVPLAASGMQATASRSEPSIVLPATASIPSGEASPQPMETSDAGAVESSPPVAAPPSASMHRGRTSAPSSDLRDQIAVIDSARTAVASGSAARGLEILRQYGEKYPAGSFRPEATALRIEALVRLGRHGEARALAERFVAERPGTPLADRVARVAGTSGK